MLWIKSFHVVFIASWFAGLVYLPRIYVNLAEEEHPAARERLLLMASRLRRFTTLLALVAAALGLILWLGYGIGLHGPHNGWMHAKLGLVLLMAGYHHSLYSLGRKLQDGTSKRSGRWFRVFNEVPVVLLAFIVILVIVKPF